jgi:uncharacterized damage-inducible protein DinB
MTAHEARGLVAFDRWANERILDACAPLNHEQFTRDLKSSYPSIRDTLGHMLAAEWVWLSRWQGESPTAFMPGWNTFTYDELRARWTQHEAEQRTFIDALTDARLVQPIAYRNLSGVSFEVRLDTLVRHVVNHSSYHRGQVTTMLRQLGFAAPATDLVLYHTSLASNAAR